MAKVLVTGCAGFIGSNVVEVLFKRGEAVRVIDNFSIGRREDLELFSRTVELIEDDIRSLAVLRSAVSGSSTTSDLASTSPRRGDFVFHGATFPSCAG
jgi:nucleoside-diphosphate-sugar epimerase